MARKTRRDLISDRFGVDVQCRPDPVTALIGVAPTLFLRNDPNRLAMLVVNLSGVAIYIKPAGDVSATSGIYLAPGGGAFSSEWQDDYDLVGMDWYAIALAAASPIFTESVEAI